MNLGQLLGRQLLHISMLEEQLLKAGIKPVDPNALSTPPAKPASIKGYRPAIRAALKLHPDGLTIAELRAALPQFDPIKLQNNLGVMVGPGGGVLSSGANWHKVYRLAGARK